MHTYNIHDVMHVVNVYKFNLTHRLCVHVNTYPGIVTLHTAGRYYT